MAGKKENVLPGSRRGSFMKSFLREIAGLMKEPLYLRSDRRQRTNGNAVNYTNCAIARINWMAIIRKKLSASFSSNDCFVKYNSRRVQVWFARVLSDASRYPGTIQARARQIEVFRERTCP